MFGLFHGLWKYLFSKTEYYVIILGLDGAGKTAFLERVKAIYLHTEPLPPDKIMPTVGLNIGRVEFGNVKLIFWDLGGQVGLRSIWEKYFAECQAIIFVVDSVDEKRFDDARQTLDEVLQHADIREDIPLLLFANKQDVNRAKSALELQNYFLSHITSKTDRQIRVQGISALTGEGVKDGVEWMCEALRRSQRANQQHL